MKKNIGRIVHFALAFAATLGMLNIVYYQKLEMIVIISILLLPVIISIGSLWEYYIQQFLTRKFPKLKWDSRPDDIAFLMFLVGYIVGLITFFGFYIYLHVQKGTL